MFTSIQPTHKKIPHWLYLTLAMILILTTFAPVKRAGAAPSADIQPVFPIRAAFYYPWFPEAWNQQGFNPFTNYNPSAGFYNDAQSVIQQQIAAMQYGGIQAGIASWWGQGTKTDTRISSLLQAASGTSFRWAVYYEQESMGDPAVAQLTNDLTYIRDHYGSDPSFLRINDQFVVFVYTDGADACAMADRWKQANTVGAYLVLKVFSGYTTCASQPSGWHQYSPAVAADGQRGYSYSIAPGFWQKGLTVRLARDLTRWNQNIRDMIASGAPFQLVTTFNEWGEGTSVESAVEWASPSGYGVYLDALHNNGMIQSQPTVTATSLPATATTFPSPTTMTTATTMVTALPSLTATAMPSLTPTVTASSSPATTTASTAVTTVRFLSEVDAQVKESNPNTNYGRSKTILVDGASNSDIEGYLRFTVSGVTGPIQNAKLRLFDDTNASSNGPAVYAAGNSWTETGITWNRRPARTSAMISNIGPIALQTWVEYNVTALVTGNGTYTFVLVADSTDGTTFLSREGSAPPQLVITFNR